ncbi:MAG: zinc ribbon domain-containing protein [Prevotella sp.]|nr:zinc ribbon domain-containing protein [Prevotella sp.]
MFCKKCGKEIPSDSNFCPYCGTYLCESSIKTKLFQLFGKKPNKTLLYTYAIWGLFHFSLFFFSFPTIKREAFFPFEGNLHSYDISELFFYIILTPVLLGVGKKLLSVVFTKKKIQFFYNWLCKHRYILLSIYSVWAIIHILLYIFTKDTFGDKEDFYPFYNYYGEGISIALNYIENYDSSELLFYTCLLPSILFFILYFFFSKERIGSIRKEKSYIKTEDNCINESKYKFDIENTNINKSLSNCTDFSNQAGTEPHKLIFKWLLFDILSYGGFLFLSVIVWVLWLLSSFGPSFSTSGGAFFNGCIIIMLIIILTDIFFFSFTLYKHRKTTHWYYFILSFFILEILIICSCYKIHENGIFEFLDYTLKAAYYLSITNFIVLLCFLLSIYFLNTSKNHEI